MTLAEAAPSPLRTVASLADRKVLPQLVLLQFARGIARQLGVTGLNIFQLLKYLAREYLLIFGIDKFMSECRALTNFTGNAVATLLIGKWTKEIDMNQARAALDGSSPFDELSPEPDAHESVAEETPAEESPAEGPAVTDLEPESNQKQPVYSGS